MMPRVGKDLRGYVIEPHPLPSIFIDHHASVRPVLALIKEDLQKYKAGFL